MGSSKDINLNLLIAAKKGETSTVEYLLNNGADANSRDKNNYTALIEASFRGYKEIVKALLDKGAEIEAKDSHGWTALRWAKEKDQMEVVKLLRQPPMSCQNSI